MFPFIKSNDDTNVEEERSFDDEIIAYFKENMPTDGSVKFEQREVKDAAETVEAIREYNLCNLFVVGRIPAGELVAAMKIPTECPELGPVGGMLLTSPDFVTTASVLIVQQYHSQLSMDSLATLKGGDQSDEG